MAAEPPLRKQRACIAVGTRTALRIQIRFTPGRRAQRARRAACVAAEGAERLHAMASPRVLHKIHFHHIAGSPAGGQQAGTESRARRADAVNLCIDKQVYLPRVAIRGSQRCARARHNDGAATARSAENANTTTSPRCLPIFRRAKCYASLGIHTNEKSWRHQAGNKPRQQWASPGTRRATDTGCRHRGL